MNDVKKSSLGKKTGYKSHYDSSLLYPIPRQDKREEIGLEEQELPFHGVDLWNAYEISWLNPKGKPEVRLAQFLFPYQSSHIIESKSFKLYLNSFNQTSFTNEKEVIRTMSEDLSAKCQSEVKVSFFSINEAQPYQLKSFEGACIDHLDIEVKNYSVEPSLLKTLNVEASEALHTHLLKSNCLVTNQPDWASVFIKYEGRKICPESLLKYIVSFREHNEFHEQCVERIFHDILTHCSPTKLTVYARYTRRGGLDINPFRSNFEDFYGNIQLPRQ